MDPISVCDRFPSLSEKYPWLLVQGLQHDTLDPFFCTINNELPQYRCRIPQFIGKRIRGCFHGWVILSDHQNNNKWALWNEVTCKIISLPTLILKDGEYQSIGECCLSAPPDDPSSILLLTRTNKSSFVFFRINSKKNKFRWTEMSYAYQIKRLTYDGRLIHSLSCCNGKVYALSSDGSFSRFVMHVDIVVKEKEVVIKLIVFGACPIPLLCSNGDYVIHYLKGSSSELFYIRMHLKEEANKAQMVPLDVYLYKSDMTSIDWEDRECLKYWDIGDINTHEEVTEDELDCLSMSRETWEDIDDLKDAIFYVDLARHHSVSYGRVISPELGGFIHIHDEIAKTIYSYHVKYDTISLFPIPSPMFHTSHLSLWECMSLWECRLKDDHGVAKCILDSKVEMENNNQILSRSCTVINESQLLNVPFDILEKVMEFCVGVEYMNFRATCKQCHLAAPLVKCCNDTSLRRLQNYSVVSPWLMAVDKKRGVMTFTDPLLGDNYFIKKSHILVLDRELYCSRFGWLLYGSREFNCLVFFNPFTNNFRRLPDEDYRLNIFCFSAPPTALDCMVVGFSTQEYWRVDILFVNQESTWRTLHLGPDPYAICFSTFYGRYLYALCKEGELIEINNLGKDDYSWKVVEAEAPKGSSTKYFLTNCNQHLLLVSMGVEFGGPVEVFKLNESKRKWEKIDSVGKHMIYICGTTCLCIEAKVAKMENKIFFPRLHTNKRKVLFYSLDTCRYHTFDGENVQEHAGDLFGTTYYLSQNGWIEPSWS